MVGQRDTETNEDMDMQEDIQRKRKKNRKEQTEPFRARKDSTGTEFKYSRDGHEKRTYAGVHVETCVQT